MSWKELHSEIYVMTNDGRKPACSCQLADAEIENGVVVGGLPDPEHHLKMTGPRNKYIGKYEQKSFSIVIAHEVAMRRELGESDDDMIRILRRHANRLEEDG